MWKIRRLQQPDGNCRMMAALEHDGPSGDGKIDASEEARRHSGTEKLTGRLPKTKRQVDEQEGSEDFNPA